VATKTYKQREAEILKDPERRARIEAETAAILAANRLARLRERAGLTQTDVARILGITQSRVSRLERAEDLNLSTLERYVAALGGELHVDARIGDDVIELTGQPPAVRA
jgi:transcriptional regulator with XRE-family HTH domain